MHSLVANCERTISAIPDKSLGEVWGSNYSWQNAPAAMGEVPERPNGTVLKTVVVRATVGSNPTLSAKTKGVLLGTFSFYLGCGIWEPSCDTYVLLALEEVLLPPSPQK
ncbi:MAG: hypothetical protein RL228_1409 [Actinomycetota bacterium]